MLHGLSEEKGTVVKKLQKKLQKKKRKNSVTDNIAYYYIALPSGFVIDGRRYGSWARFVNHSCVPNCIAQSWYIVLVALVLFILSLSDLFRLVDKEYRVGIFAACDIPAGTELCFDYG